MINVLLSFLVYSIIEFQISLEVARWSVKIINWLENWTFKETWHLLVAFKSAFVNKQLYSEYFNEITLCCINNGFQFKTKIVFIHLVSTFHSTKLKARVSCFFEILVAVCSSNTRWPSHKYSLSKYFFYGICFCKVARKDLQLVLKNGNIFILAKLQKLNTAILRVPS